MKKNNRKPKPQPPKWAWYELDGCWFCKKKNACGGCKVMKQYAAKQKEKIWRDNKKNIDFS